MMQPMAKFRELIRPGVTELDIADKMLGIYKELGADDYSFTPLVGFGGNAANGHHGPDKTPLKRGTAYFLMWAVRRTASVRT